MSGLDRVRAWFRAQGWTPYPFQLEAWESFLSGESGLIHVPTGAGKTYAAAMGPLAALIDEGSKAKGLRVLYITPLKAVSRDIQLALERPVNELGLSAKVEARTGDTSSAARQRQRRGLPEILVTTPESFSLLLTYPESKTLFKDVNAVILDEWHELLSSKRGSLLELDLARLRRLSPKVRTWALSATLANLDEAASAAVGTDETYRIITASIDRPVSIETLIPDPVDEFPWSGHLGLRLLEPLARRLSPTRSTLIFTNTRNQAERWYQALKDARPGWGEQLALHHGSLDREERERVEAGLKSGEIPFVVCTSSLDLGVDFGPVEQVVQIGSPKGIARLLQRAGRSGHRPGATASLLFVPTNAFELVEIAACRMAILEGDIEPRHPLDKPLDVLVQHPISRALGGGFSLRDILEEIRGAYSYRNLSERELDWAMSLIVHGGESLQGYPAYHKVVETTDDCYRVVNERTAKLHRLNIGTIVSEATIELQFVRGGRLGTVEESFVTRLKRGDRFLYGGRCLEFVRMKDLKAQVKLASGTATVVPSWQGGRLPFSGSLARALRASFERTATGASDSPELVAAGPVLQAQAKLSRLPERGRTLIESCQTREGSHLFIYPFEGRSLHEGLAAVLALRIGERQRGTFSISVNDYGLELLSPEPYPFVDAIDRSLFTCDRLLEDIRRGMNLASMSKAQFREIARVAGLIFQSYPGAPKSIRQVQVSSSLLFDVFEKFDPSNLLLHQAERQVLDRQMDFKRLATTLERLSNQPNDVIETSRPTPLAFALIAERIAARVSTESLAERIERMKAQWTRT